jgi:hypothetical protein
MKCGWWQAKFSGEFRERRIAAFLAKKDAQLFFKSIPHPLMLADGPFRLRNN